MVQLHLMSMGYQAAMDLRQGAIPIKIALFARLRKMLGTAEISVYVGQGATIQDVLRKFFNYYPPIRNDALEQIWQADDDRESLWMEVVPVYALKSGGWRILLNGRNVEYGGGLQQGVKAGDVISVFPPGRSTATGVHLLGCRPATIDQ
jgi:molybdopterin converting factor small subunit